MAPSNGEDFRRSLLEGCKTFSAQSEMQYPAPHESFASGTATSYFATPLISYVRLIRPSSFVSRLYTRSLSWNFVAIKPLNPLLSRPPVTRRVSRPSLLRFLNPNGLRFDRLLRFRHYALINNLPGPIESSSRRRLQLQLR